MEIHFPPAKMAFVRLFIVMTALQQWSLYQLDVQNALQEEIYMEQPPGFVAQGGFLGWYVVFTNPYKA